MQSYKKEKKKPLILVFFRNFAAKFLLVHIYEEIYIIRIFCSDACIMSGINGGKSRTRGT
jgi:hypothetical protein